MPILLYCTVLTVPSLIHYHEHRFNSFTPVGYFAIDSMTGVLSVAAPLDREFQDNFTLYITATDQGLGNNQANVSRNQ